MIGRWFWEVGGCGEGLVVEREWVGEERGWGVGLIVKLAGPGAGGEGSLWGVRMGFGVSWE